MKQAGQRSHLVRIQQASVSTGGLGGETRVWNDIGTAWAEFFPGSGQERREGAKESASVPAVFNFDHMPLTAAIKPTDRLYCFSTVWDVFSAVTIGSNESVDVTTLANLDADS